MIRMINKLVRSFSFAYQGLIYCFKTQKNMRVHFFIALVVFMISYWLELEKGEFLIILLTVALVWVAEIINTSLEKIVDLLSPQYHPLAGIAKNVAAGAVLVSAIFAVIVGILIFGEKLLKFLTKI